MSTAFWRQAARIGVMLAMVQAQTIEAQGPIVGSPRQSRPVETGRILGQPIEDKAGSFMALRRETGVTRVIGTVLTTQGLIVPAAGIVLLRSLTTGKVVGQVKVDQLGQFGLAGFEPGLYVAEVIDAAGSIIATSPSFAVGFSEVVSVAPIIPANPLTSFAYWATNSTATAVNSATSAGIIATDSGNDKSPKT
jgi:hypothetical protein